MSIKELLQAELIRLEQATVGHSELSVAADGRRVEAELWEVNPLACSFSRLTMVDNSLGDADITRLKGISEKLASRLTYLLEPIQPIEIDAEQCTVQMRSNPPQMDETGSSYYELVVKRPGAVTLVRYNKPPGEPRRMVPAHVTREVFVRLANDLCQARDL